MGSHPPFCRCLLGCGIPEFFLEAGQSSGDFPIPSTPQTGGQRLQQWRPITRLPVQLPRHCCCFEEKKQKNAIHCSTLRMQFPALIQLVSLRGVFLTFCLLTMGTEPCITLGGEVGAGKGWGCSLWVTASLTGPPHFMRFPEGCCIPLWL